KRIGADGAERETRRCRNARATGGYAGPVRSTPRIDRRINGGVVLGKCPLSHLKLSQHHCASNTQPRDPCCVLLRPVVCTDCHARGSRYALRLTEILNCDGNAVQRPAHFAACDLRVGFFNLGKRKNGSDGRIEAAVETPDAVEDCSSRSERREFSRL